MSKKTTAEKIEVMQAFERGEQIEFNFGAGWKQWEDSQGEPSWEWSYFNYRIAPKPKKTIEMYQWLMEPDMAGYWTSIHYEGKPPGAIKRLDDTKIVVELD